MTLNPTDKVVLILIALAVSYCTADRAIDAYVKVNTEKCKK